MVNTDKLRGKIVENRKNQNEIASAISMSRSTFMRKMANGGNDFTVEEVNRMMLAIPLSTTDVIEIFLS